MRDELKRFAVPAAAGESTGEGVGCVSLETAFMRPRTPGPQDFDELGHVNNVVYVRWVQEIAVEHWAHVAPPELRAAIIFVVLRHAIDYRDPVLPGESVEVRTWLGRASGPRFARFVDIRKPGAARFSARAESDWCQIDAATRRPKRVGAEMLTLFGVPG